MAQKLTQERRGEIARRLAREGKVSAPELARRYQVSAETIRRDLIWLQERGVAQKGYGGAVATAQALETPFLEKAAGSQEEKRRIARAAAAMVPPGAAVLLDSGSTALEVARQLAARTDIQCFTNSLEAARLLVEKRRSVTMLGGRVRLSSRAATGDWAVEALGRLHVQAAILGASGFDGQGAWVESLEESQAKKAMLAAADRVILVADAGKAHVRSTVCFAGWEQVGVLVTDRGLDGEMLKILGNQVETVIV